MPMQLICEILSKVLNFRMCDLCEYSENGSNLNFLVLNYRKCILSFFLIDSPILQSFVVTRFSDKSKIDDSI